MSQVLIANGDPNQRERELLTWELADEGYTVDTASDGAEAIQKLGTVHPDVVVLGLSMHGRTGVDTMSQIMGLWKRPAVVIYSAHERCKSRYAMKIADDFVVKSSDLAPLSHAFYIAPYGTYSRSR